MADAIVKQIADAQLARIAAIVGIGNTGLVPRLPEQCDTFPAVFLLEDKEEKEERTMGTTGGNKTVTALHTWVFYTKDLNAYTALANVAQSIEVAVEAAPYNLGVAAVLRVFVAGVERYNPPNPIASPFGAGEIAIRTKYDQPYGAP